MFFNKLKLQKPCDLSENNTNDTNIINKMKILQINSSDATLTDEEISSPDTPTPIPPRITTHKRVLNSKSNEYESASKYECNNELKLENNDSKSQITTNVFLSIPTLNAPFDDDLFASHYSPKLPDNNSSLSFTITSISLSDLVQKISTILLNDKTCEIDSYEALCNWHVNCVRKTTFCLMEITIYTKSIGEYVVEGKRNKGDGFLAEILFNDIKDNVLNISRKDICTCVETNSISNNQMMNMDLKYMLQSDDIKTKLIGLQLTCAFCTNQLMKSKMINDGYNEIISDISNNMHVGIDDVANVASKQANIATTMLTTSELNLSCSSD